MRFHLHRPGLPGLIAAALVALPSTAGMAGPAASSTPAVTYSRYDRNPVPGMQSRIGVGVEPRIGVGVEPRIGIGADTGVDVQKFIAESPRGVPSPSEAESPSTVREAQRALSADGLAPDTNGIVGPRTRQAIRTHQRNHNLPMTGVLDHETRHGLGLRWSEPPQLSRRPPEERRWTFSPTSSVRACSARRARSAARRSFVSCARS